MSSPAYCRQKLAERGLDVSRMSDAAVVMRWTGRQYYPGQEERAEEARPESELLPAENRALFRMPGFVREVYLMIRRAAEKGDYAPIYEDFQADLNITDHKVRRALVALVQAGALRKRPDLAESSKRTCYQLPLAGMKTRGMEESAASTPTRRDAHKHLIQIMRESAESGKPLPGCDELARQCGYSTPRNARRAVQRLKHSGFADIDTTGHGANLRRYVRSVEWE